MPAYSYRPLSRRTSIRILQLLPNNKETDRVECCLAEYSLSGTQKSHQYEALSYVWGNPNDTKSILVNGHDFQLTQSLYTALLHIRDDQLVRRLWLDVICINQNDEDEKASQIPLMRDIYGYAYRVLVWLGDVADNSDEAFETIRFAGEQALHGNTPLQQSTPVSESNKAACLELLRRDWFRRIWVLQEVGIARDISIMYEKPRDVSLIWSWRSSLPIMGNAGKYEVPLPGIAANAPGDCKDDIRGIVEDLAVKEIAKANWEAVNLVLGRVGITLPVTEKVLIAAATSNEESHFIRIIESSREKSLPLSSEVVEAAAGNDQVAELRLIQRYCKELRQYITDKVLKAGFENVYGCACNTIKILHRMCGQNLPVTEDVLKAATRDNADQGVAALLALCEYAGESPPITEDVLEDAPGGKGELGHMIMNILFDYGGEHLAITEAILCKYSAKTMQLLCEWFGESLPITQTVLRRAVGVGGPEGPEPLSPKLRPDGPQIPRHYTYISEDGSRMLEYILYYGWEKLHITDETMTLLLDDESAIDRIRNKHARKTRSSPLTVREEASTPQSVRDYLQVPNQ
ncbi:heterokaryon incompatibility protein-domain-containing protein [Aspergillus minisclerotigenes]|uniref:Heterokaryon incompatibility protein-domain-containing protein n=1 Tax=Aspergillus minisclerotigenes TaxID=656917 RepID=A0A5N6JE24_9EURO|nr:heterokaryon incompatibility protein-domain-containing protein [Aspergillus minisclerotigenes]